VTPPLLRLASVRKSYWRGPTEVRVLRDVSLDVHAGDLVAVYGQRDAGKTTLLKLAAGHEEPDAGAVLFGGRDLAGLSRRQLSRLHREEIGWVERGGPRSIELSLSIVDFVALPLFRSHGPREAPRRAVVALRKVGVERYATQPWETLTNTARVLVAIAQALVREPKLLVVDDPTGGLDIVDRERVVGLLRSAAEEGGLGVLMAVPDMPAMLHAHQVRSLSRGRLLAPPEPPPEDQGQVIEFPGAERSA
jgi:ABC-type lipoprotein export system ATPase subunit